MSQQDKWEQPMERQASAYHEAGHAVFDIHVGLSLKAVDIRRKAGDLGGCECDPPPDAVTDEMVTLLKAHAEGNPVDPASIAPPTREWIDKMIRSQLAGRIAEVRFRGRSLNADEYLGIIDDQENVQKLANVRWTDGELAQRLREVEGEVEEAMAQPALWRAVQSVAQALLEKGELTGTQGEELYRAAVRG